MDEIKRGHGMRDESEFKYVGDVTLTPLPRRGDYDEWVVRFHNTDFSFMSKPGLELPEIVRLAMRKLRIFRRSAARIVQAFEDANGVITRG